MSVRLFVLGIIYERDSYGYEIKETAHIWGLERWAQIRDGSIYHALGKLEEEGLIQELNVEIAENQRPRYVYRITEKGQETFLALLRETCRTAPTEGRSIDLVIAFLENLPPDERVVLLKERHDHLLKARANLLSGFDRLDRYENLAAWVPVGMRHSLGRIEFEIAWNLSLIENVGNWPVRKRRADDKPSAEE